MRYLVLIYDPPVTRQPTEAENAAMYEEYREFGQEVTHRGVMLGGEALQGASTATTVRVRDGRTLVTDGPFAETKEVLGGYYLFDCRDLDEVIELAAKIPGARTGSIEIRPIMELMDDEASRTAEETATRA